MRLKHSQALHGLTLPGPSTLAFPVKPILGPSDRMQKAMLGGCPSWEVTAWREPSEF